MVFGSHAKTCAMYSTPPGPSLAASTAAYRRRSFSDSQPKNRFIFCSTSAAYTSIPHSLIRHLLWGKDTAAQTIREVIFDHILRVRSVHGYRAPAAPECSGGSPGVACHSTRAHGRENTDTGRQGLVRQTQSDRGTGVWTDQRSPGIPPLLAAWFGDYPWRMASGLPHA